MSFSEEFIRMWGEIEKSGLEYYFLIPGFAEKIDFTWVEPVDANTILIRRYQDDKKGQPQPIFFLVDLEAVGRIGIAPYGLLCATCHEELWGNWFRFTDFGFEYDVECSSCRCKNTEGEVQT